jgi:hypothetical protein
MTDTNILVSLLGLMATVAGMVFWRMFCRMEKKIDYWFQQHIECREKQQRDMIHRPEFDEWKKGRDHIWKRLHGHKHDTEGKVVITAGE